MILIFFYLDIGKVHNYSVYKLSNILPCPHYISFTSSLSSLLLLLIYFYSSEVEVDQGELKIWTTKLQHISSSHRRMMKALAIHLSQESLNNGQWAASALRSLPRYEAALYLVWYSTILFSPLSFMTKEVFHQHKPD